MTNRTRFLINGLLLTLVGFTMRGVALFLGAYVSGVIGAEGVGLQSLIGTVYSFAVTLATSGVGLSVTRLVASAIGEGGAKSERILRGAFLYALIFGGAATLLLCLFAQPIGAVVLGDTRVVRALYLLSFSTFYYTKTKIAS